MTVRGQVRSTDGRPIANALLDIWQTAPSGLYHMQDAEQPEFNLCGKIRSDAQGRYEFRTLKPVSYPIPTDGPVGKLLKRVGRHPYRPAHIHFIVSADGYKPVVTQLFTEGDQYLDSDAVFGVKNSLVVEHRPDGTDERGQPKYLVEYDFVLEPMAVTKAA